MDWIVVDKSTLLASLNEKQCQAVSAPLGNLLVLAGAGSGKTRVLINRIAWLCYQEGLSLHEVMAVTFTNKAAGEMKHRLSDLLGYETQGLWVGTFHGLAHRLLRQYWQKAGLVKNFQILDSDDQLRMVKRVIKALQLDEDSWQAKQVQWFINGKKDEGLRPKHIQAYNFHSETQKKIYENYEQACQRAGVIDFAEILLRAHELFLQNEDVLHHYQQRFKAILVDEFQDTNTIQYAWIRLIAGGGAAVMAVGDDDQSIYGWRGAKIENIHKFNKDFANAEMIRLEQNYRSSANILQAANGLIANNQSRMGKNLWTNDEAGEKITVYAAFNEMDEARFIVERIAMLINEGQNPLQIAVLYRSNAQSRVIEESLVKSGINYRIVGGVRFFERAEIKDCLAYLRLTVNHLDDNAFERVVNFPTRGIGERTLDEVRHLARKNNISLWQASHSLIEQDGLTARAKSSLSFFLQMIVTFAEELEPLSLHEKIEHLIIKSGLKAHFGKIKGEKSQMRLDNMQELVNAAKQFQYEEDEIEQVQAFLAHAVLESGEAQDPDNHEYIHLMTLHAAKGLEFESVFLSGLEEGVFPSRQSHQEPGRLEEERRLCYVGMTRAMTKLTLSYAEIRRLFGREEYHKPSRFLQEIPSKFLDEIRVKTQYQSPKSQIYSAKPVDESQSGFILGQQVTHAKFGQGVVINFEGRGAHARIQVKFGNGETKWLVIAYANLQTVDNHHV